ncbi:MAG TPA: M10 family metallopeptidase C-terminal domain-containing protein [Pseudomonas sp.]|nr:M10 family metallopeptidase C-terminal domain-containing protein [Pseudomonas sp.]
MTFVHEIGHALGLKHPFDSDGHNGNTLPAEVDDVRYTVMSYTNAYGYEPTTPMLLDITAIQYLYGANMAWHTGNDSYQWGAGQSVFETIWDAGGTDTLDASNQTQAVVLNLNAGAFSSIGASFWSNSGYINNGLTIAYGAQIENALGSAHNDSLIGNAVANVLNGGAGADSMSGGDGSDIYYVDHIGDVVSETNALAAGGIDTLYSYLAAYSLGVNIENGRILASGTANLSGNGLNNVLYAGVGNNVLDGAAGIDTASYTYAASAVTVSLATSAAQASGGSGSDTLLNIENLTGSNFNDTLTGNALGNSLNGGAGADSMSGGNGSDSYYVDNLGDTVNETNATTSTGGTDIVYSYLAAYSLGANLENGRILVTSAANLSGNSLNNTLYAGAGNNVLNGGAGNDTLSYLYAASAVSASLATSAAQATGGSGSDSLLNIENLNGSAYNDTLTGNAAANVLNGGAGADSMSGGDGSDSYYVDNAGDLASETNASATTGGSDTVYSYLSTYSLGTNIENGRILASGTANLGGNGLNNVLYAGAGNNVLDGAAGSDTLSYLHAASAVTVSLATSAAQATGGSGSDTLLNIENLAGSNFNDTLTGNALTNVLNGGAGADSMSGGDGSDSYYVDNIGDVASETNATSSTGGIDTLYSYLAAYSLAANIENGRILASGTANLGGNGLNNILYAGAGNNVLDGAAGIDTASYTYAASAVTASLATSAAQATGGSGSDTLLNIENLIGSNYGDSLTGNAASNVLNGGLGNDTLWGGLGNDLLTGGLGVDRLNGGGGADRFDFNALNEMGLGALRDVITDFLGSAGDRIDLSTLDANSATLTNDAFSFIGSAAFSAAGQLRFADSILYGSTDADTTAEFEIQLLGVSTLNSSDLIA